MCFFRECVEVGVDSKVLRVIDGTSGYKYLNLPSVQAQGNWSGLIGNRINVTCSPQLRTGQPYEVTPALE